MKSNKTLPMRLQSRISLRRNVLCEVHKDILLLKHLIIIFPTAASYREEIKSKRIEARKLGVDQMLDKALFQVVLSDWFHGNRC